MSLFQELLTRFGLIEKNQSANAAKDRLKVVVSHQRGHRHSPDYLPMLEKDILAVIAKYVEVEEDKVKIRFDRGDSLSTLEVNVDLPTDGSLKPRARKLTGASEDLIVPSRDPSSSLKAFGDTRSDMRLRPERKPEFMDK